MLRTNAPSEEMVHAYSTNMTWRSQGGILAPAKKGIPPWRIKRKDNLVMTLVDDLLIVLVSTRIVVLMCVGYKTSRGGAYLPFSLPFFLPPRVNDSPLSWRTARNPTTRDARCWAKRAPTPRTLHPHAKKAWRGFRAACLGDERSTKAADLRLRPRLHRLRGRV